MIFDACWGIPTGLVLPCCMGHLSLNLKTFPCAQRKPNWKLPRLGHVADILTTGGEEVGLVRVENGGRAGGGRGFWAFLFS